MRLLEDGVIDIVAVTDPVKLGLGYQAMLGITVGGDTRKVALEIGLLDDAVYVVMTTGRFDLLVEIVVRNGDELIDVSDTIRMMENVTSLEVMSYLGLTKQTYDWGVG